MREIRTFYNSSHIICIPYFKIYFNVYLHRKTIQNCFPHHSCCHYLMAKILIEILLFTKHMHSFTFKVLIIICWDRLFLFSTEHSSGMVTIFDVWILAERTWYANFRPVWCRNQFLAQLSKLVLKKANKFLTMLNRFFTNAFIQDDIQLNADTFLTQPNTIVLALIQDHHYLMTL